MAINAFVYLDIHSAGLRAEILALFTSIKLTSEIQRKLKSQEKRGKNKKSVHLI